MEKGKRQMEQNECLEETPLENGGFISEKVDQSFEPSELSEGAT